MTIAMLVAAAGLAACASAPTASQDAVRDEPTPQATTAQLCGDLGDAGVLDATRKAYAQRFGDAFDAAVASCAATPDASFLDVATAEKDKASNLAVLDQAFPVTDKNGYTFDLIVDFALKSVTADPSSQPPGLTAANRTMSLAMKIKNTTAQRSLTFEEQRGIVSPLSYPTFAFYAAYNAGNPLCVALAEGKKNGHADLGCRWQLGFGRMENGFTVSAGSTYDLKVWGGVPNGGQQSVLLTGIPESEWSTLVPYIQHPDGYSVTYAGQDYARFQDVCDLPGYDAPVILATSGC
jgi:hypothetical protein